MRPLLAAIALLVLATSLRAQNADVNAERVSMDMQLLQAIDGRAPLGSMSVWPQSINTLQNQARATDDVFGRYIDTYYDLLLPNNSTDTTLAFGMHRGRFRGVIYGDSIARATLDLGMMLRPGYAQDGASSSTFLLARPSVRLMGSFGGGFGYAIDLSNGARIRGASSMIARTDPVLERTLKFGIEDSAFFDRYIGYVQYQSDWLRIRYGREAMQFGFSPIDNFVHSIDAPLLDGLLIDIPYKSFRFTMTHSAANGTDTLGKAVPGKFIATHRVAFDPAPWLSMSLSDMIVYWGRGLDFAYLNPLAFFVSAGLGTPERNANDNSIIAFDISVRPFNGTMIYGSFVADDLNFGSIGDTSIAGNNNKFAYQLGASQLIGGSAGSAGRTLLSLEYARIDPFTFSHRSMNASYTTLGAPIGYNMQSNSDRIAFQLRHWFTARTFVRVDLDYTRHGENILDSTGRIVMGEDPRFPGEGYQVPVGNVGGDILRGDGDFLFGSAFLRGNVSHQRRIRVWFSAEWMPNIFTDLRVGYTNRNGGNTPEDFFFGSLELRVGY